MVFKELTNLNPINLCGMATTIVTENVTTPSTPYDVDFCYCNYECEECYDVWGGGLLDWQNDNTAFAFIKTIATDTFSFSLWKNGVNVATITDNTYGDFVSTYTDNHKQYSFVIDWDLVYQAFGFGKYVIKNNYTVLGLANEYVSQEYCLSLYNDREADGYIKIDWFQEGNILSNNFKFKTPLFNSIKFKGYFTLNNPKTNKDSYATSSREIKQFRTEQINNYTLTTKLINESLYNVFNENVFLAEKLTITDFNLFGTNYKEKNFKFVECSELNDEIGTRKIDLNLSLEDYKQHIIKDSYCD